MNKYWCQSKFYCINFFLGDLGFIIGSFLLIPCCSYMQVSHIPKSVQKFYSLTIFSHKMQKFSFDNILFLESHILLSSSTISLYIFFFLSNLIPYLLFYFIELISFFKARLGISIKFLRGKFVSGLVFLPCWNHVSISSLSYVCPSTVITGSYIKVWVMGQYNSSG